MRYLCQTTDWGGRSLGLLKLEIPQLELVVDNGYRSAFKTFCRSLALTDEPCVRLEDDAILCENFTETIEQIIAQQPDALINFFSMYPKFRFGGRTGLFPRNGKTFLYNVCTYYPEGYASRLLSFLENEAESEEYDVELGRWLQKNNLQYYQYSPNIVNHSQSVSLINASRPQTRTDKSFNPNFKKK